MVLETVIPLDECVDRLTRASQAPLPGEPRMLSGKFYVWGRPVVVAQIDGSSLDLSIVGRRDVYPMFSGTLSRDEARGVTLIEGSYQSPPLAPLVVWLGGLTAFFAIALGKLSLGTPCQQACARSEFPWACLSLGIFWGMAAFQLVRRRRSAPEYFRQVLHATVVSR